MRKLLKIHFLLFTMVLALIAISCKDDSPTPPSGVVASFQFVVDATVFNKVQFTNFSVHAASLSWNFGDGTAASTEENPEHTFATEGKYTVTLTATGADKVTSEKPIEVTISDPNVELKKLTGETSKTWKLLRDASTGVNPLQVGSIDYTQIWWSSGAMEPIGARPCLYNDEYIFSLDGKKFEYKTNGDIWKDGDVWSSVGCADTSDPETFKNKNGDDISAWGDGVHTFAYDSKTKKLSVNGTGAFLGLCKVGSTDGVLVPQASTTYSVIKLVDDVVDTLIVEATFPNGGTPGYWRFVMVHYDNPALEPAIPVVPPKVTYSYVVDGNQVTFTNTSDPGNYNWDFGDGSTSTDTNPVHTYSAGGFGMPKLTVTNPSSGTSSSRTIFIFLTTTAITNTDLNGGGSRIWKLAPTAGAFGVGDYKGGDDWWPNGGDISGDRPCLFNDEFIFKTGSVFQYDAKTDIFGESYLGAGDGCVDESNLTGNAAIFKSGNHTYSLTPASGGDNATITVAGLGAFIALPKAHNGGEYGADTLPTSDSPVTYEVINFADNGTTQAMQITIDIGNGGFWSFILVSE